MEHVTYNTSDTSNKRQYTVLKRGAWSHSLNKNIWEAIKCPCTIAFKRAKVYPHGILKCLDIIGACADCSAQDMTRCNGVVTHSYETGEVLLIEMGTGGSFTLSDFLTSQSL